MDLCRSNLRQGTRTPHAEWPVSSYRRSALPLLLSMPMPSSQDRTMAVPRSKTPKQGRALWCDDPGRLFQLSLNLLVFESYKSNENWILANLPLGSSLDCACGLAVSEIWRFSLSTSLHHCFALGQSLLEVACVLSKRRVQSSFEFTRGAFMKSNHILSPPALTAQIEIDLISTHYARQMLTLPTPPQHSLFPCI